MNENNKCFDKILEISKEIEKLNFKIKPKYNELMKNHTSFKIGGEADIFIEPSSVDELKNILKLAKEFDLNCVFIGNGSNLLVRDEGVFGIVIKLGKGFSEVLIDDNIISAESGALFSVVGKIALENSLDKFYPLAGIPSSVGGGIVMNAGAYGTEIKDVLLSATVLTKKMEILKLTSKELELGYRTSNVLKNEYIVLGAEFKLEKGDKETIKSQMAELSKKRRDTQPLNNPNAGSTFKRPEGNFAGKLIEDSGLKGKIIGGAMVSDKHAGFIVNHNNGTAKDVLELVDLCKNTVKNQFNVDLQLEIKVIGGKV